MSPESEYKIKKNKIVTILCTKSNLLQGRVKEKDQGQETNPKEQRQDQRPRPEERPEARQVLVLTSHVLCCFFFFFCFFCFFSFVFFLQKKKRKVKLQEIVVMYLSHYSM